METTMETMYLDTAAASRVHQAPVARYASHGARVLLGLMFFVLGLNGILHFIPEPKDAMPAGAAAFAAALAQSGYMVPLLGGVQTFAGALLLANRYVPLALTILAPIVVNIVAFHLFLAPAGLVIAALVLALELFLAYRHRAAFRSLLVSKNEGV
jgi:hypothetical protein